MISLIPIALIALGTWLLANDPDEKGNNNETRDKDGGNRGRVDRSDRECRPASGARGRDGGVNDAKHSLNSQNHGNQSGDDCRSQSDDAAGVCPPKPVKAKGNGKPKANRSVEAQPEKGAGGAAKETPPAQAPVEEKASNS